MNDSDGFGWASSPWGISLAVSALDINLNL